MTKTTSWSSLLITHKYIDNHLIAIIDRDFSAINCLSLKFVTNIFDKKKHTSLS